MRGRTPNICSAAPVAERTLWVAGDTYTYVLVVDELFRDQPRLDRDQVLARGLQEKDERAWAGRAKLDRRKPGQDELDQIFDQTIRSWRRMVRPFHEQLEDAVGGRIKLEKEPDEPDEPVEQPVERLAQMIGPPYRLRKYRRGNGRTVFAQVAETLEQRIAAELVDLLRLAPVLSRCPLCERVSARRRGCGGFVARAGVRIEDCRGRPMRAPAPDEFKRRRADEAKLRRDRRTYAANPSHVQELERRHREKWPLLQRGQKSVSGDEVLP